MKTFNINWLFNFKVPGVNCPCGREHQECLKDELQVKIVIETSLSIAKQQKSLISSQTRAKKKDIFAV